MHDRDHRAEGFQRQSTNSLENDSLSLLISLTPMHAFRGLSLNASTSANEFGSYPLGEACNANEGFGGPSEYSGGILGGTWSIMTSIRWLGQRRLVGQKSTNKALPHLESRWKEAAKRHSH